MKVLNVMTGLVALLFLLTACKDEGNDIKNDEMNQKVIFQFEYENFAWGHQHVGWFMNSSGYVFCYNLPDSWTQCDAEGFISASNMDFNLTQIDSICCFIDKIELNAKIDLIEKAAQGEITEPVHEMCDAGIAVYAGFIYNPSTEMYKRILLKQVGDFRVDNTSPEAVALFNWLDTINLRIFDY